jgi:hypothetical protein
MTLAVIMPNDDAAAALQAKARARSSSSSRHGRREHHGLRAGAAAPGARPVVEDGSGAVGQLSRDLDEAVGVLPATRLENDRGTGTPEDANGDTLSPGLDRSRDSRGRCMKGHARARESDCEARSDDSAAREARGQVQGHSGVMGLEASAVRAT